MSTQTSPLLELHDVSYSYAVEGASVSVLQHVSFQVGRGELVAIQGPSGSGKSTLLYLIGCLMKPQTGHIRIDGQDITSLTDDQLAVFRNRKIGFIFQQFHLLAKTNVLKNILLPTLYPCEISHQRDEDRARAEGLAASLGLAERLDHTPNQLSGGQQQRVAIARALMNNAEIILADEPTGNLDSASSTQIMLQLKELTAKGRTVIVITHDNEIAAQCQRVIRVRDGKVVDQSQLPLAPLAPREEIPATPPSWSTYFSTAQALLPMAVENLYRNKIRTLLTMMGITIGIAAVVAMVTLGQFTKEKILQSYAELGVNTLMFYGHNNWDQKAIDRVPVPFRSFSIERDLNPLKTIFPSIQKISPTLINWNSTAAYNGKTIDTDVRVIGVTPEALKVSRRELLAGANFSPFHMENRSPVCIVGYEIGHRLFTNSTPMGQILSIIEGENSYNCRIIGVLKSSTSNQDWMKPNLQVFIPLTYFQAVSKDWWATQIHNVLIQVDPKADIESVGRGIRAFFEMKYGKSGRFRVDSDSVLVAQMQKFLTLFTVMLATIALISLAVGGIGITNMMLVSVSERFREIGLRKALGATNISVRIQFLVEAVVICLVAGLVGIFIGIVAYQSIIYAATRFVPKLQFEWVFDWTAMTISLVSILAVGLLSGFFPALKAERLQVIEALRSE